MKRRIQVAGREILCKDITHVGIEDENGYIQYYHRDDFTYIKDKRKGQLEEYCKKISKSLHDNKLIVIEMSPFRRLLLKNKKLHCVKSFWLSPPPPKTLSNQIIRASLPKNVKRPKQNCFFQTLPSLIL